jgi:chaperonin GroEL
MTCEYEDPYILITDQRLSSLKQMVPILEVAAQEGKPLLIIADDIEGEAHAALILNIIRGSFKVCAVKAPGFGDERKAVLEDIAVLTGATVISEERGMKLENVSRQVLGKARTIRVDDGKTLIVGGKGERKALDERMRLIESQINIADSELKKEELRKRLGSLSGGVAVIKVGAATETELKEKKMRIEDALNATKAAVEEGVVVGGGVTLFRATGALDGLQFDDDRKIGVSIVRRALEEPVRQIAKNAGVEGAEVVAAIKGNDDDAFGYNAKTGNYENLMEHGVIDPTKVVRLGLQNAASIAGLILSTEVVITDFDEEKDQKTATIII